MSLERGRIPQEIIDEIAGKINIVDVIGRYVPLKKQGQNFIGLCPFHNEKTPSFSVSQNKQIFHCFGCGAGGNVFRFLMDIEHMSFPEAVKKLADETGVKLPEKKLTEKEKKIFAKRQSLLLCNKYAAFFYQAVLHSPNGKVYKKYLEKRGISEEIQKKFQIGACLEGWDHLYKYLKKKHINDDDLVNLGLIGQRNLGSGYYDKFRDRLMFPIQNVQGDIIAFGGRIIDTDKAPQKYINSPDSELFHKGKMVYGLHLSKSEIRSKDQVILVEGYMDVISFHQAGIYNVVAPLGTALTEEQVKLLMRYSYNFLTALDGDKAGQKATLKSLDMIERLGGHARVILFPEQLDPDECMKKYGVNYVKDLIANSMNSAMFRTEYFKDIMPNQNIDDKVAILNQLLPHLSSIKNSAELETVIRYIAQSLLLSEQAIKSEIQQYKSSQQRYIQKSVSTKKTKRIEYYPPDEIKLLNLLLAMPAYIENIEIAGGEKLFSSILGKVYNAFYEQFKKSKKIDTLHLDENLSKLFATACMQYEKSFEIYNENSDSAYIQQLIQGLIYKQLEIYYQKVLTQIGVMEKGGKTNDMKQALLELENIRKRKTTLEKKMRGDN